MKKLMVRKKRWITVLPLTLLFLGFYLPMQAQLATHSNITNNGTSTITGNITDGSATGTFSIQNGTTTGYGNSNLPTASLSNGSGAGFNGVTLQYNTDGICLPDNGCNQNPGQGDEGGDIIRVTYTVSPSTGYSSKIRVSQKLDGNNGNDEASTWKFTWTGGGTATWHDPTNGSSTASLYRFVKMGGTNPTNGEDLELDPSLALSGWSVTHGEIEGNAASGSITSGGTLSVFATNNNSTKWYIEFPDGVTSVTVEKTVNTSGTGPQAGRGTRLPVLGYGDANSSNPQPGCSSACDVDGIATRLLNAGASFNEWVSFGVDLVALPANLSGNVFIDTNGLSDNTVNGTGINNPGSTQLYANLIGADGNVVATVAIDASGAYNFPNVVAGTYTVQVSTNQGTVGQTKPATALPTGWIHTGENTGTGAGSDGTPDGEQSVTMSGTDVTQVNFGIKEAQPYNLSGTVFNDMNGLDDSTVNGTGLGNPSSTSLHANLIGTDGKVVATVPVNADGTYNFTNILEGNYEVQISTNQGTVGQNKPATNLPTGWINTGENTGTAAGNDGTPNGEQAVSISGGDVTDVNFGIKEQQEFNVSGNVFNDTDALTDNTVDGTGINTPGGTQLYANLVDASGNVVQSVQVNSGGSYTFSSVPEGNYTVQVTTNPGTPNQPKPATNLPTGWSNTGETIGTDVGSDGTPNGETPISVSGADVTQVNFGIRENTSAPVIIPCGSTTIDLTTLIPSKFPTGTSFSDSNGDPVTVVGIGTYDYDDGNLGGGTFTVTQDTNCGSISGNVSEDQNGDGTGTKNLSGVTIKLLDSNGNVIATTTTGTDGNYSFSDIPAGTGYQVQEVDPTGLLSVSDSKNGTVDTENDNLVKNITVTTGQTSANNNFVDSKPADRGDLPTSGTPSYPDLVAYNYLDTDGDGKPNNDAAVWLGSVVSYETTPIGNADANGDTVGDDALAIKTPAPQTGTNRTAVWTVTVNSAVANTVFYELRIDWNIDGTFDAIYKGSLATSSPASTDITIAVPDTYDSTSDQVNVRLVGATSEAEAAKTNTPITNGEVEDYQYFPSNVLPVDLVSFTSVLKGKTVELRWKTATENNNEGFEIMRSEDGRNFDRIGWISGHGTTKDINSYTFIDRDMPIIPTIYYKLKQIDYDGNHHYSKIVNVHSAVSSDTYIYPNPVVVDIVQVANFEAGDTYQIFDMNGRVVYQGAVRKHIDLKNIAEGSYVLKIFTLDSNLKYETVFLKTN